jgi:hypothetical protein
MAITRAAAVTITELISRSRVYLDDRAATPIADTVPAGFRRWSDTEITEQINNALVWMGTEMQLQHEGDALVYADLTYTEPTTRDGMDLPSGVDASAIYEVEDRQADFVSTIRYAPYGELSLHDRDASAATIDYRFVYSLISRGTAYGIIIRPIPLTSRSVRIWYAATPLITTAAGDAPLLSARWRDFIAKKVAVSLLSPSNELPTELFAVYKEDERQFKAFCARRRGPIHVRQVNRGAY